MIPKLNSLVRTSYGPGVVDYIIDKNQILVRMLEKVNSETYSVWLPSGVIHPYIPESDMNSCLT